MKKCPAEIAGNGISRPLNLKKKIGGEHAPFGGPCFLNKHLQNLKLHPWKRADVHATSNKKTHDKLDCF